MSLSNLIISPHTTGDQYSVPDAFLPNCEKYAKQLIFSLPVVYR